MGRGIMRDLVEYDRFDPFFEVIVTMNDRKPVCDANTQNLINILDVYNEVIAELYSKLCDLELIHPFTGKLDPFRSITSTIDDRIKARLEAKARGE